MATVVDKASKYDFEPTIQSVTAGSSKIPGAIQDRIIHTYDNLWIATKMAWSIFGKEATTAELILAVYDRIFPISSAKAVR